MVDCTYLWTGHCCILVKRLTSDVPNIKTKSEGRWAVAMIWSCIQMWMSVSDDSLCEYVCQLCWSSRVMLLGNSTQSFPQLAVPCPVCAEEHPCIWVHLPWEQGMAFKNASSETPGVQDSLAAFAEKYILNDHGYELFLIKIILFCGVLYLVLCIWHYPCSIKWKTNEWLWFCLTFFFHINLKLSLAKYFLLMYIRGFGRQSTSSYYLISAIILLDSYYFIHLNMT